MRPTTARTTQRDKAALQKGLALGAILLLLIASVASPPTLDGVLWANDERPEEGHFAPDFTLKTLDGKAVRLSTLRGKKVVLINFWATWCPPCRLEMPTMERIYSDYKAKGFEILAINIEPDAKEEIREFTRELRLTFPVLLDPDMRVTRKYRLIGLPVSMLIDRQGIIRSKDIGYHDWTSRDSRKRLEDLLQ